MAKNIKGITIDIGGDTSKLQKSLNAVNAPINKINKELKDLNTALKLDPKNTELLAQKQEVLRRNIEASANKLKELKNAQKEMGAYTNLTDEQKAAYNRLSTEIAKSESAIKDLNKELKNTNKIDLQRLNDSLSGVRETTERLLKDIAKIGTAIGGALTAIGISSIKSYAEYEQLVGGVEAMFGGMEKGAKQINKIQKTSQNAWKELTMSQNDYYRNFTNTYPLVKSSIEDENEAIEVTNRLLKLNSDLSNTFGYSIETASNAINWALKGSFNYIDNLNIGIKGTKEGFLEAAKNSGYVVDSVNELSSSQILDVLEQYANKYGVLGRTAEEASNTIQGSTKMLKSSWDNLKLAISDNNADMEKAVNDFVDSTITASKNILPRIKVAINGIKKLFNSLIRDVFPKIKKEIPELTPLINVFEWFIDHKDLLVTALKAIVGAFVTTKIIDFAAKTKQAFTSLMQFATGNVAGALVTSIGAVVGVFTLLATAFKNETEEERLARIEMEKHTDSLKDQIESWNSLQEAQEQQINKGMTELSYYENLYNELKSITDENGRVQKGYEKRAEFITGQLKEAFGIEIEYQDGLIKKYEEIEKAIDKVIEKKKAEIIMEAQKGTYSEAKTNEAEAVQNLIYWEKELQKAEKNLNKAKESIQIEDDRIREIQYNKIKEQYDKQKDVVDKYQHTIAQYEQNLVYIHEEAYDKINTTTWEFVKSYKNANDIQRAELEKTIETEEKDLELWQKKYEETGDEIYKTQVESVKRSLDKHKEDLKLYISAINEKKGEMKTAGGNFIAGFDEGIESKKGSIFGNIWNLGKNILSNFKKSLQEQSPSKATREMGEYLLDGLSLGIKEKQNNLFKQVDNLGNNVIDSLYFETSKAMRSLNESIESSVNPTINPTANSNPLIIQIENFNNERESDVQQLAQELEFYRRNSALAKGGK